MNVFFKILIAVLFVIISVIHLYHSWKDDDKNRKITKPFLLPLITCFYLISIPTITWTFVIALFFAWLGDIFLMQKGQKFFSAGGISFLISHLFLIFTYIPHINFNSINYFIILSIGLIYVLLIIYIVSNFIKSLPKILKILMTIYLGINAVMNIFALMQYITLKDKASLLILIGTISFYISDLSCLAVRCTTKKEYVFKKHFTVMITYLIAFVLITFGISIL